MFKLRGVHKLGYMRNVFFGGVYTNLFLDMSFTLPFKRDSIAMK